MRPSPFFSILLPTKNRSHLINFSIKSVLVQDFIDFELIICDNDDDPLATLGVVKSFYDVRIKYIRTGGLDMVDNWNVALDAACGHNVIVLEDKMMFYVGALTSIKGLIDQSDSRVVVWKSDSVDDETQIHTLHRQTRSKVLNLNSEYILKDVIRNWQFLPRGLCSSVPLSLIKQIVVETRERFYSDICPDLVSALKVLAFTSDYTLAGDIFTLITSSKVSNGGLFAKRLYKDLSYFMGDRALEVNLETLYVKSNLILANVIFTDCLRLQKLIGGRLCSISIGNRFYFECLLKELIVNSIKTKKLLWSRTEIAQLFFGGDGLIINLGYLVLFLFAVFRKKFIITCTNKSATINLITLADKDEFLEGVLI